MSDRTNEEIPPLGEPTPGRAVSRARPTSRAAIVVVGTLVVGLVAGFTLGHVVADGHGGNDRDEASPNAAPTLPRSTTTVGLTVPAECQDAMRSAEHALALLDQGFQSLRRFQVGDLDAVLTEMQELRSSLSDRVRDCLEQA